MFQTEVGASSLITRLCQGCNEERLMRKPMGPTAQSSLRLCLALFKNKFSLFNPELGTHDLDGSVFETWEPRMRQSRQRVFPATARLIVDETPPEVAVSATLREKNSACPGSNAGTTYAANHVGASTQPARQVSSAPIRAASGAHPAMKYGYIFTGYANSSTRQQSALLVQPTSTP